GRGVEGGNGPFDARGSDLRACRTGRRQTALARPWFLSTELDCPQCQPVRYARPGAACPGERRSAASGLRFLRDEGPDGGDTRHTEDRGRAPDGDFIACALAERGWYLRAGGEH